jgi:putative ABC transport system permease protein
MKISDLQLLGIEPVSLPSGAAVAGQALAIEQVVEFFTPPGSTWISPRPCRPWACAKASGRLA